MTNNFGSIYIVEFLGSHHVVRGLCPSRDVFVTSLFQGRLSKYQFASTMFYFRWMLALRPPDCHSHRMIFGSSRFHTYTFPSFTDLINQYDKKDTSCIVHCKQKKLLMWWNNKCYMYVTWCEDKTKTCTSI